MNKKNESDISALKVENLTVNYDKTPVLWDINFSIPQGKIVGILGPNGAGKSTLLKTALCLLKPLSGKVTFFDLPFKKARKRIAYVPQRSSVDWDFPITVFDVVLMGSYGRLGLFKWPSKQEKEAAKQALELVGMHAFAHRQISQLSNGQQQRVFIARALMQEADIYLLDEPFAGVDAATEKAIISLLADLKLKGKTLLVVHHDLTTVESYFDWVVLLNTCLIASGSVKESFNPEMIARAFGKNMAILDEAARIAQNKMSGHR